MEKSSETEYKEYYEKYKSGIHKVPSFRGTQVRVLVGASQKKWLVLIASSIGTLALLFLSGMMLWLSTLDEARDVIGFFIFLAVVFFIFAVLLIFLIIRTFSFSNRYIVVGPEGFLYHSFKAKFYAWEDVEDIAKITKTIYSKTFRAIRDYDVLTILVRGKLTRMNLVLEEYLYDNRKASVKVFADIFIRYWKTVKVSTIK